MATRQGLDSSITTRLGEEHQSLFVAVKAEFDTDDIRIWTGGDDLTINSETYTGAGSLLTISGSEETAELKSSGISIAISGMDSTVLNYALTENYQNRPVAVYLGFLMGGSNEVAGTLTMFKGRMVNLTINDSPEGAMISLDCENRLVDLERPSNLRYTVESQQFLHNGDTCFNRVQGLQDKQISWGQKQSFDSNAGGRHDTNKHVPRQIMK